MALLIVYRTIGAEIHFDLTMQTPLMLAFFASLGLSADFASLRKGGKSIALFLLLATGLLILQNVVGVGMATVLGLPTVAGLLAGSVTLVGGHGTGAAWSQVFTEQYGLQGATEMAMACATLGLVLGGLLGGPVARVLLPRVARPAAMDASTLAAGALNFEEPQSERQITPHSLIEVLALILICLTIGQTVAAALAESAFSLPTFVWVLVAGVLTRNLLTVSGYAVFDRGISVLGNVSLSVFLAMALMSLRLWELAALALPILAILAVQTATMAAYAIFITFPVMGRNYDAVVLAAGHCGSGLGATPTAIANMQAVTDRFGPSHLAFLVVPIVGAFFIDLVNAVVINLALMFIPAVGS
jgi:ESS family glutamate:Na+ symporter